jgi:hypothetical protein
MAPCARLSKAEETTAPRSAFWPIAHVVILSRQRPQASPREHGARWILRECSTRVLDPVPATGREHPIIFEIPTPADRWTRAAASRGTLASKIEP